MILAHPIICSDFLSADPAPLYGRDRFSTKQILIICWATFKWHVVPSHQHTRYSTVPPFYWQKCFSCSVFWGGGGGGFLRVLVFCACVRVCVRMQGGAGGRVVRRWKRRTAHLLDQTRSGRVQDAPAEAERLGFSFFPFFSLGDRRHEVPRHLSAAPHTPRSRARCN